MTIAEEIKEYTKDCIEGIIPSGKKHIDACKRFLDDYMKSIHETDYPYTWNEQRAKEIVDWFSLFQHSKGVLAGTPIYLTAWQKFILCQLYGWRRKNGNKRFNKMFIEVGRKNARDLAS